LLAANPGSRDPRRRGRNDLHDHHSGTGEVIPIVIDNG
jgi:hypothetical protein